MVNRNLLASQLAELADRVARVRPLGALSVEELTGNRDAFDLASFNLMLAVQVCADIASHLIADERWPAAKNLVEGFTRLEEQSVISTSVAQALRKAVGLRKRRGSWLRQSRPGGHPFCGNEWAGRSGSIFASRGKLGCTAVSVSGAQLTRSAIVQGLTIVGRADHGGHPTQLRALVPLVLIVPISSPPPAA